MPDLAENRAETATRTTPPGRPFQPGNSANPGGRPKGIARYARDRVGNDGHLLIDFMVQAMTGRLPDGVDAQGQTKWVDVPVRDRLAAAMWLGDRGFGKAPQFAPIEEDDPLDLKGEQELEELAAELDASIDELAAKRAKREAGSKRKRRAA